MRATNLHEFSPGSVVVGVSYDCENLIVTFSSGPTVTFPDAVGFRVLDEGDLLEFWPACSSPSGAGVFEVHEGGWLNQEGMRNGFVSAVSRPSLREFLITGQHDCVGVFAFEPPKVADDCV